MPRIERALTQLQPILFGVGVVIARFAEQPSVTTALMRPLIVVFLLSAAVSILTLLIVRDRALAPMIASFVVLLTLREPVLAAIYVAIAIWWVAISGVRRAGGRKPPPRSIPEFAARAGGYLSAAYLAVMTLSAVQATASESAGGLCTGIPRRRGWGPEHLPHHARRISTC